MNHNFDTLSMQGLILALQHYWQEQGCILIQSLDLPSGAGTFHPGTFLRCLGPEPWYTAYPQICRRPSDGRYGENPNRLQQFHQFQVILKPSPDNIQELYINSLKMLNIEPLDNDLRFVEDNWESPTLGAWGLGWEIWLNGLEVGQFTYFQQIGGIECRPISGEITYGLERLAMQLQGKNNVYDLIWGHTNCGPISYGELFKVNEAQMSQYNFTAADLATLQQMFEISCNAATTLLASKLTIPAYEMVIQASHNFNTLDARGVLSVTERQNHILTIRKLANQVAVAYCAEREEQGFPLMPR